MKEIPGYEGFYAISDSGTVISVRSGRQISQWKSYRGYWMVTLRRDGKQAGYSVHCLVLSTFVGPKPSAKHQGCHGNGDKSNNNLLNLRWDTVKGNHLDKKAHGTWQAGESHGMSKLNDALVRKIRASSETHAALAREIGVSETSIAYVRTGKTWAHVT